MSGRQEILALAAKHETLTLAQIRASVSIRESAVPPLINLMIADGQIERIEMGLYALPSKAASAKAITTDGPAAQAILRALNVEPLGRDALRRVTSNILGAEQHESILMRLSRQGFVVASPAGFVLTSKGRKRIPRAVVEAPPIRPYVQPPAPPRRPGSMDFARAPSVMFGAIQPVG